MNGMCCREGANRRFLLSAFVVFSLLCFHPNMSAKKGSTEDKFLKAAQENNQDVLLELFEEVSNVNVVDGDGRTGMTSTT